MTELQTDNSKQRYLKANTESFGVPESRPIFELAGKRKAEEVLGLISKVEQILVIEATEGANKMGRNIEETRKSQYGDEYFVDQKIAYLPPRGKCIFIGDTHGDSISTESIIRQTRFVREMEKGNGDLYLVFLGDYADRGKNDVRNLEIVLALKENYPRNVILMMGNHEEGGGFSPYDLPFSLQKHFGKIAGDKLHEAYTQLFRKLPDVLITANRIVAVHAGVPKEDFSDLQTLRGNENLFFQIRWNDPDAEVQEFARNSRVGGTYVFGKKPFNRFMGRVGANVMVRSHEYPYDGYELMFDDRLVTIFSNGGASFESNYQERVNPKFIQVSLDGPISKIDPRKHIFSVNFTG